MSNNPKGQSGPIDPWKDEGQIFRAVAVLALLFFGGFVFYDGPQFHAKYLKRCADSYDRPECAFLDAPKPKLRPDLGIVMDHESGKWAIQLDAADEKTANENSARLWAAGANPRLIKIIGRKKAVFYYLQLGRFKTRKDALDAGAQLRTKGLLQSFALSEYRSASK
ncbi:MAG TPA: SPOR domain-containing protein [Pyrinomonadaceae bacterium]|nr:SPOR domain-containing protein [Pyrinomonadaceae bacterium]